MGNRDFGCALATLVILMGVAVVMVPSLYRAGIRASRHARHDPSSIHLGVIYGAIRAYERTEGRLPPAHTTVGASEFEVSWRVLILPQLGFADLYQEYEFDHPWNAPRNTRLATAYMDKLWAYTARRFDDGPTVYSDFVAVTGEDTVWCAESGVTFSEIQPIASNLILAVQVKNCALHWMEPRDITLDELANSGKHGTNDDRWRLGSCVLFADGVVWRIKDSCPASELTKLATLEGARTYSRDHVLERYRL
jgi:hypothetical protein